MVRFLLHLFLLLSAINCLAQKDSVREYLDAELHFTTKRDAAFAAMAIKQGDHWILYGVYPDTSVLLQVFYKDAALTIKDGPFTLYHPKGVIAQKGFFKNNIADGSWKFYYPNGQAKDEGEIVNNHLSGIWNAWYENGFAKSRKTYVYAPPVSGGEPVHENSPIGKMQKVVDDFTVEGTLDGEAGSWYENGTKESVVNYRNDSLSGTCNFFRPNGQPSTKEVYAHGKLMDLECYDEEGKYSGATCSVSKLPVLIHPVYNAADYVINELHKEKHRGIISYGEATVTFTVTTKGTVENITVISSPDATLSKLIVQIVAGMPLWSPAVTHNRKLAYPVKLLIPYYGD